MGAKTELFPTFPELCAIAREVEKKPISIPASPIDGKLVLDENFGIFPREFEDYTYGFLLFEAQKIERRLSADAIASSQPAQVATERRLTPEQQMENDLHKFVYAQEQESLDEEEGRLLKSLPGKKEPAPPKPLEVADYEQEHPPGEEVPVPEEEETPQPQKKAAQVAPPARKAEVPSLPQAKPRVLPAIPAQKMPGAPQIPPSRLPVQQTVPAKQAEKAAPKIPAPNPSEQDIFEPPVPIPQQQSHSKEPGQPGSPAEKKPPAGISSYSKLSPRLQALIEAKLRREEDKVKKAREDSNIFKGPQKPPEEEPEEKDVAQELAQVDAPNAWNLRDEAEEREEEGEKQAAREPAGKSQRKVPLRKMESEAAPMPDEEGEIPQQKEEPPALEAEERGALATKPAARKEKIQLLSSEAPSDEGWEEEEKQAAPEEKEAPALRAQSKAPSGPITIKPMFPDSASPGPTQEKQEISQAEDSDRMRRIQRIIEELSPDKMRAQPKQEVVSFEKDEEEKEPEEHQVALRQLRSPAEADEAPSQATQAPPARAGGAQSDSSTGSSGPFVDASTNRSLQATQVPSGKKTKAQAAALKKPAGLQKKKAAAPQERQPAAPAKKLPREMPAEEEESAEPEEKEEEIPIAKKAAPKPIAREEESQVASKQLRSPAKADDEEQEEEEKIPVARKAAPKLPAREAEEPEEQTPSRPLRKLVPRLPVREEPEEEAEPEQAPAKLKPRLPPREEADEEEEPVQRAPARRRILPGMGRTAPATPQTYVPPARERKQAPMPQEEAEEKEEQEEAMAAPEPEPEEISPRLAPMKPRKLVSDEAPPAEEKTREQLLQEQKMAKMAEQLARLEAGKVKEVAGTAALPTEEEDVPLPDDEGGVPKPQEYEQAKESLRKSLEHEETARKVKQEDEATVEQYAKDHLVWLYEIYKMGGMAREDFLQKASEKYTEAQQASPSAPAGADKDAPPNPALAALSKEIEKKDKK